MALDEVPTHTIEAMQVVVKAGILAPTMGRYYRTMSTCCLPTGLTGGARVIIDGEPLRSIDG
jgi:hypothetical protein